ncbi:DUF6807 family protein [Paenibacillus sp. UNC451MF]|uniref:DUF6807 family protein n=1 Tax=Paenibacillus sp. UNC451MF TaxID=1449063 RepID=UPI000AF95D40
MARKRRCRTNASGKQKEAEIFGTVTEWVDYSGTIYNQTEAGIAVFSYPTNETLLLNGF